MDELINNIELVADLPTLHDNGMFFSAKVSRIVELIREHDPRLDVKFIPRDKRSEGDAVFAITERLATGREVVAFYVNTEEEFDERVLARIFQGDNTRNNVQDRVECQNRAARAIEQRRKQDQMDEAHDMAASMWNSPLHTYRHNGKKLDN